MERIVIADGIGEIQVGKDLLEEINNRGKGQIVSRYGSGIIST